MQIHDLNTKTLTDPAYVAFDDGTDTYKANFHDVVADAVADVDLTQNQVEFTSEDAASPTTWVSVALLTTGSTLATLFNLISKMVKNVRFLKTRSDSMPIFAGTRITSGSNLNNYTTPGAYRVQNGTDAARITNTPWTITGYKLIVCQSSATTNLMQIAIPAAISANRYVYMRSYSDTSQEWGAWTKFTGTAMS